MSVPLIWNLGVPVHVYSLNTVSFEGSNTWWDREGLELILTSFHRIISFHSKVT